MFPVPMDEEFIEGRQSDNNQINKIISDNGKCYENNKTR